VYRVLALIQTHRHEIIHVASEMLLQSVTTTVHRLGQSVMSQKSFLAEGPDELD